MTVIISIGNSG